MEGRDGRLTFVVSGMLWQRSLVMQDKETGSLWSHILGRAMEGVLKGTELAVIPSVLTDWRSWKEQHPEGDVVHFSRTAKRFTHEFYRDLDKFVLAVEVGEGERVYPFSRLRRNGVVNDRVGELSVVVTFSPESASANAFVAKVAGQKEPLEFEPGDDNSITDGATRSVWNRLTGIAVSGEFKGERLERLPGIPSYRAAWQRFHPSASIYGE